MSQGSFSPKIRFLGQKVCSVDRTQTDRQTDTKVNTEDTLSGFQDFSKFSFNLSSRSGPKIKHLEKYEFRTIVTKYVNVFVDKKNN